VATSKDADGSVNPPVGKSSTAKKSAKPKRQQSKPRESQSAGSVSKEAARAAARAAVAADANAGDSAELAALVASLKDILVRLERGVGSAEGAVQLFEQAPLAIAPTGSVTLLVDGNPLTLDQFIAEGRILRIDLRTRTTEVDADRVSLAYLLSALLGFLAKNKEFQLLVGEAEELNPP
jgi:hypothetical protein